VVWQGRVGDHSPYADYAASLVFCFKAKADIARWCVTGGTDVPFSEFEAKLNLLFEQFWGRAARASMTRKSRDAC